MRDPTAMVDSDWGCVVIEVGGTTDLQRSAFGTGSCAWFSDARQNGECAQRARAIHSAATARKLAVAGGLHQVVKPVISPSSRPIHGTREGLSSVDRCAGRTNSATAGERSPSKSSELP